MGKPPPKPKGVPKPPAAPPVQKAAVAKPKGPPPKLNKAAVKTQAPVQNPKLAKVHVAAKALGKPMGPPPKPAQVDGANLLGAFAGVGVDLQNPVED